MKRKLNVFLYNKRAGTLIQSESGYIFEYSDDYAGKGISLSLPVSKKRFESNQLFPYFQSLEEWLKLRFTTQQLKHSDILDLLVASGNDIAGAIRFEDSE